MPVDHLLQRHQLPYSAESLQWDTLVWGLELCSFIPSEGSGEVSLLSFLLKVKRSVFSCFLKKIMILSPHLFCKVLGCLWLLTNGFLPWEGPRGQTLNRLDLSDHAPASQNEG